jgi:hypothetical protein
VTLLVMLVDAPSPGYWSQLKRAVTLTVIGCPAVGNEPAELVKQTCVPALRGALSAVVGI